MTQAARAALAVVAAALLVAACDMPDPRAADAEARRIVTLAPNLAEIAAAAGAADLVVGTSAWTDFPPALAQLPQVGDAFTIDHEVLASLDPDLLLAWKSGMPAHTVDDLRDMGYRVEVIETRRLDDVAEALLRVGELTGRRDAAAIAAADYRRQLVALQQRSSGAPVRVFFQVASRPLYTVSGAHYISEMIELCGAENVFADLDELAPAVDVEAVIARDPGLIIAGTDAGADAFAEWDRWPEMRANRAGNRFRVRSDITTRAAPRLATAATELCALIDKARHNLRAVDGD